MTAVGRQAGLTSIEDILRLKEIYLNTGHVRYSDPIVYCTLTSNNFLFLILASSKLQMKKELEERERRQFFLVPAGTDLGKDMVSLEQLIPTFVKYLQNPSFC